MRICSETHSISWHNKEFAQVVSTELLLAFNPAASRRHVHRRFQIHCVLLHYTVSSLHSTNRRLASRFHSLPDFTRLNRLGSLSTNSAAAATAETAESFPKNPGPSTVAANCAATGQSSRMFITKHPSRCFPSFLVVVIAATISDQHVLTIHGSCVPAMVS